MNSESKLKYLIDNSNNKYAIRFYSKLFEAGYKLVEGVYRNAHTHVTVQCNKGHQSYKVTPNHFTMRGRRCAHCWGNSRKTNERFKSEVHKLSQGDYIVLGEYKGDGVHVLIRHISCLNEWSVTPSNFIKGHRCPKCGTEATRRKLVKTTEQFKQEVYNKVKDEYEVLGEYKNGRTNTMMKHNICGHEWKVNPGDFLHGKSRCPKCMGSNYHKDTAQFKDEVFELVKEEYVVLGEYQGARDHVKMQHRNCKHIWEVAPTSFLSGTRCPRCNSSRGERLVETLLRENNITYVPQEKLDECKNEKVLPFDFGVYRDRELIALIEYQGVQHYKPVDFGSKGDKWAEDQFKKRQYNDSIKRAFCKENDIPLIEIKYSLTDKEVGTYLMNKINQYIS